MIASGRVDRRGFLALGLAAATVSPGAEMKPDVATAAPRRIDTHQHFLPQVYVDAVGLADLASVMPNRMAPAWSAQLALEMMDRHAIAEGILSISSGPRIPDAANLLRKCNDEAAALRQRHPGRFGSFASLPLPDIDASLREIAYSLDTLKADGFIVFSSYDGKYAGDPLFAPVLAELNRRKAVVFIHPNHPPYQLAGLPPESVLEFPFDTTRCAASLIFSGALRRWPDIRFLLAHAGGTLPFLNSRLGGAITMNPDLAARVGSMEDAMKHFWFDTALSASKEQLAALLTVADPARITFGTDFPMAPGFALDAAATGIDRAAWPALQRAAVNRGNAARLLGRV